MKQSNILFGAITFVLLSMAIVSAIDIYSGECNSIIFPNTEPVNWSVEGNSSNMNGFSYEKNGTNITYCFHPGFKPDNFTITFYNHQEVVVDSSSSSGGGSSGTIKDWSAKCGYNLECLYGKNETKTKTNETIEDTEDIKEDIEENIEDEVEKKIPTWIWIVTGFLILGLIIILIKTYFFPREEYGDYEE